MPGSPMSPVLWPEARVRLSSEVEMQARGLLQQLDHAALHGLGWEISKEHVTELARLIRDLMDG